MAQRQSVSGRRSCVLYSVILAVLILIVAGIVTVVVVRPEMDRRRQAEARLVEAERHYQAGVAFQKVGDWEAAETEFKQVITLAPNYKEYEIDQDTWCTSRFEATGQRLRLYVNDVLELDTIDDSLTAGGSGLYTWEGHVSFDDIRVTSVQ